MEDKDATVSEEKNTEKAPKKKPSGGTSKTGSTRKNSASTTAKQKSTVSSRTKSAAKKPADTKITSTAKIRKTTEKQKDDNLFASVPSVGETLEAAPLEITKDDEIKIEEEAIASLPHAESLDSILFDSYEELDTHETPEETASYESFLADYKEAIASALSHKTKDTEAVEIENDATIADSEENEAPLFVKEKSADIVETVIDATGTAEAVEAETENISEKVLNTEALKDIEESNLIDTPPSDVEEYAEEAAEQMVMDFGETPIEEPAEASENQDSADLPSEADDEREEKYDPEKPRRIDSIFEFVELFVFTLVAVMVITSFFFRHSVVDGSSMQNTLQDGEHLIISDVFYTPSRGDIIVFEDYSVGATAPYVKRVIGIAGDTVKVEADGGVYVNGEKITEDYVYVNNTDLKPTGEWTVSEGEVFVMGDHRNVSEDSRTFGPIDEDSILGKVILRFYPFSEFGAVE